MALFVCFQLLPKYSYEEDLRKMQNSIKMKDNEAA